MAKTLLQLERKRDGKNDKWRGVIYKDGEWLNIPVSQISPDTTLLRLESVSYYGYSWLKPPVLTFDLLNFVNPFVGGY
jgi:hypothetical protein